jgi:hypothetical protein
MENIGFHITKKRPEKRVPFSEQEAIMTKPLNDWIEIDKSFDAIKPLKKHLQNMKLVMAGNNIDTIKAVHNIILLVEQKDQSALSHFFRYYADDGLKNAIKYSQGYNSTFSLSELKKSVKNIVGVSLAQQKEPKETTFSRVKEMENLALKLDNEKQDLEYKIKELLRFQENALSIAQSKARLTAGTTKKNFAAAKKEISKFTQSNIPGSKIDVNKLKMKLWGRQHED